MLSLPKARAIAATVIVRGIGAGVAQRGGQRGPFPEAREAIRALKRDGLKTEPAFGQYFGIMGDPYAALLDLAALDDETLLRRFAR